MSDTPWFTLDVASVYASGGALTKRGRRKFSERYLRKEINEGRLRGARIGGRGEYVTRREWVDEWITDRAVPVVVSVRRRA